MIKVQGNFKPTADSKSIFAGDVFLFVKVYLNATGTAEAEAIIYEDQEIKNQIGAVRLPNFTSAELVGGAGDNDYDKIIDKASDLAIANFQTFNTGSTFSKVNVLQPAPEEVQVTE